MSDGTNEPVTVAVSDADLGAAKPVAKPEPTERERREWNARNITVRHAEVTACGHKLDMHHAPTQQNCDFCWEVFFSIALNAQGVAALHKLLQDEDRQGLESRFGKKFTRQFGKYLQWQLMQEVPDNVKPQPELGEGILSVKEELLEE
jgi:hypothetical protein